jgi:hypothetical protein
MSKTIDERIPREIGKGALPDHPAVKTPWEKLISFHDAYHFALRHNALVDAIMLQALRILIPDYETRADVSCRHTWDYIQGIYSGSFAVGLAQNLNIHPFMRGSFYGSLIGDNADEALLMQGRVNDFGTYRNEKELDACPWDIVGSEFCRNTVCSLHAQAISLSTAISQTGPNLDFHMVEARGCGDLHCRIVAEDRGKYPMPEHKIWDNFGPVATADQIKFTPEEDMATEPQHLRADGGYTYFNGLCREVDAASHYLVYAPLSLTPLYLGSLFDHLIQEGKLDEAFVDHVIKCVFEAAGKTAFGDFYAAKGLRDWLGVPNNVNDGRVLGAYIETLCQMLKINYEVEAFNEKEVVYRLDRAGLTRKAPRLANAHLSLWYGMSKTLISAQWAVWEESEDTPDNILRVKIAKKIDKFC